MLRLDPQTEYVMLMALRLADCEIRGLTQSLRRMGCEHVPCGHCDRLCLCHPEAIRIAGRNPIVVCMQCAPDVADMMDNLDEPSRRAFHELTRVYKDNLRRKRPA